MEQHPVLTFTISIFGWKKCELLMLLFVGFSKPEVKKEKNMIDWIEELRRNKLIEQLRIRN